MPSTEHAITSKKKRYLFLVAMGSGGVLLVTLGCLASYFFLPSGGNGVVGPTKQSLVSGSGDEGSCDGPEEKCNIRLDPNVIPKHYRIYLHPDIEKGVFTGVVDIDLEIYNKGVDHIRLHTKYLNISNTELISGGVRHEVSGYENPELEYWVVKPEMNKGKDDANNSDSVSLFPTGSYKLHLTFSGNLTMGIVGLYRASYRDGKTGENKFVVSSKFQPTYARRAFPCFDEPGFKSTFTMELVKPKELTAISNMPIEKEVFYSPSPELTTVIFQKSVPMVTYLVALAIGDFSYLERKTRRGLPVRIYTTAFQIKNAQYASNITADLVDFYEEYFGINYPLPKLDIVGIPDFVSGAMEHWGMVSFRELNLLYEPGVGSAQNKQRVAAVISHELSHMWFGNLMTLKWWNDLWLNEGFASYLEYKGVDAVHPDWDIEDQFVVDDLTDVLGLDGQHSSHPIVQEVHHPNQITELFDRISYGKGASVIRMLENFMSPSTFRAGVHSFLTEFSFRNAETSDLWDNLQAQVYMNSEEPLLNNHGYYNVTLVMDTWTRQKGYPLVTLEDNGGKWIVKQERFLENRDLKVDLDKDKSPYSYKWEVPVGYQCSSGEGQFAWIRHTEESVDLPLNTTSPTSWIKLNTGLYGFYRVRYPVSMYPKIQQDFHKPSAFRPTERCGLLDDAFALAFASYLSYDVALDFAKVIRDEEHVVPWKCLGSELHYVGRMLKGSDPEAYDLYKGYLRNITSKIYDTLEWSDSEEDPHLQRLLKPIIFKLACEGGYQPCLEMTEKLFQKWIQDQENPKNQVPGSLRGIVYEFGVEQADPAIWDNLLNIYLNESNPQESTRLLKALTSSSSKDLLLRFLELTKNDTIIKKQDFYKSIRYASSSPAGDQVLWDWYRKEYEALVERFTINDRYLGRMIVDVTSDFATKKRLNEVEEFFSKNRNAGAGTRARKIALENVQNNIAWTEKNVKVIKSWLQVESSRWRL